MRVLSKTHRRSSPSAASSSEAIVQYREQSLPTTMFNRTQLSVARRIVLGGRDSKRISIAILLALLTLLSSVSSTNANSLVNFQLNHVVSGSLQSVSSIQPSGNNHNNNNQHRDDILSGNSLNSGIDSNIKSDLFGLISEVNVECNAADIKLTLRAPSPFNGMIYPRGLSKNSSCMSEYSVAESGVFQYSLPLRACNTMSTEVQDGVEYFNTVIVQPHRRLVTNQGRGYQIRCRYQTKEKRISNVSNGTSSDGQPQTIGGLNVSMASIDQREGISGIGIDGMAQSELTGTVPIPSSSMKIFIGDSDTAGALSGGVAENVKIGDKLTLVISIDQQDIYGMKVTNCLVRDGLNWGEQPLINDEGCPVDREIMGQFGYSANLTRATVTFHAHKFPYTSSVYYQCNVRLCLRDNNGCDDVPPKCDRNNRNYLHRSKRDTRDAVVVPTTSGSQYPNLATALASRLRASKGDKDMSMEVYSGLYVDESENTRDGTEDDDNDDTDGQGHRRRKPSESEEFCISMRKFAIGVAIASLLLMFAVILLVICILQRRRRRNAYQRHRPFISSGSTIGSSSIYSGPYTNRAYSRD